MMECENKKLVSRFLSKVNIKVDTGCWEWLGYKFPSGYGSFKKDRKTKLAHRASYEIFKGDIPSDKVVMHSCDNPSCVNPNHLSVGTCRDNTIDMFNKGRGFIPESKGEYNGRAKLSKHDVQEIRTLYSKGDISQSRLAEKYKVSQAQISDIVNKKVWA